MLKARVIPTILWKDIGIVKGVGFNSWRRVGSLLPAIKVYNTRQVDELIIVDITATGQDREPDYDVIDEIADE
jgi:cyclase